MKSLYPRELWCITIILNYSEDFHPYLHAVVISMLIFKIIYLPSTEIQDRLTRISHGMAVSHLLCNTGHEPDSLNYMIKLLLS